MADVARFVLVAAVVLAGLAGCTSDQGVPTPSPPGQRSLTAPVRTAVLEGLERGHGWEIDYPSRTALGGVPSVVTGVLATPDTPGPWPLLAWAHGTTGLADACAPSRLDPADLLARVAPYVDAGYAVVATDYEGLGSPGPHPYLVGESEARSVLDGLRAARQLLGDRTDGRAVVVGHSRGGHAALFTAQLAATTAPDVDLRAAVAIAPVTELEALRDGDTAGFLVMVAAGFAAAYAQVSLDDVLRGEALDDLDVLDRGCVGEILATFARPPPDVFVGDPLTTSPWPELLQGNTPGGAPSSIPVLVVVGDRDRLVTRAWVDRGVARLTAAGWPVETRVGSGDHVGILDDDATRSAVLAWLRAQLDDGT